jgi:hypothetical protein
MKMMTLQEISLQFMIDDYYTLELDLV